MTAVAHNVNAKRRTNDVLISENVSFSSLLLSDKVLDGLKNSGFIKPSPIQLKAIPLGRCGLDLIVQAKSGTGKTCVFSVIALESISTDTSSTQVLVLAPTREIAVQIWEVIRSIGSAMKGLECHTFIGGLPLQEDRMKLKKCHIAVGSPGRIKQLIETGVLRTENIRMFVLDEADKLLEEGFQDQINWIFSTLPENKQMLALSATYPEYLADHLTAYMRNPTFLRLNISDPALLGIRQYYHSVTYHPLSHVVFEEKCKVLINILSSVSFQQCLVFSNIQTRASNLADTLTNKGWPTACIAGCLDQKDRNHAMAKLKTYKCRILISTDLTARGIDADKVNLVINMDIPKDHETYLHRIGRAGRFGSFGIAVSLVSEGQEKMDMNSIEKRCNTIIHPLPDPLPTDLAKVEEPVYLNDVVSAEVIDTNSREIMKTDLHTDTVITTEPSSLVNGEQVVNSTNEKGDNDLIYKGDTISDGQHNLMKGGCSRNENSGFDRKTGLTVYDLSDNAENGLQFMENRSAVSVQQKLDTNEISCYKNIDKHANGTNVEGLRSDEKPVQPLKTENSTKIQTTYTSPENVQSSPKTQPYGNADLNCIFGKDNFHPGIRESSSFHSIPIYKDLNLSKIFKNIIGYREQEHDLTHSFAKQSLNEFRDTFSGYRETPPINLPNCSQAENKDLLRKDVCQLQELFDRNIEFQVNPQYPENKMEICSTHKAIDGHNKLKNERLGNKFTENKSTIVTCDDKVENKIVNANEIKHDRKVTDTDVTDDKDVTTNKEEMSDVPLKNAIQKQTKPRKHYTNKFAIAYLVEPGSSVFNGDGKTNENQIDRLSPDDEAGLNQSIKLSPQQVVEDGDYSNDREAQSKLKSSSKNKATCGNFIQNDAEAQETPNVRHINTKFNDNMKSRSCVTQSTKPRKVTQSTKPRKVTQSTKPRKVTQSTKPRKVTQSTKPRKVTQSTKAYKVEQCTNDSDSDSSTSSSSESEDDDPVYNNPYGSLYRQNIDSNHHQQQYPSPYYVPYAQTILGVFPYQHMHQHNTYQPFMNTYQYPVNQNPWLGYSSPYRNFQSYRDLESSNQQVQSHMEKSFNMQTEYIKAMSKSTEDGQKRSKRKPKSRK